MVSSTAESVNELASLLDSQLNLTENSKLSQFLAKIKPTEEEVAQLNEVIDRVNSLIKQDSFLKNRNARIACFGSFASGFYQKNLSDLDLTILVDSQKNPFGSSLALLQKVAMLVLKNDSFSL